MKNSQKRANSIDILRGLAVIMMTFSGMIPFDGALPVWMYHAQEPPPTHDFNPNLAGLTWVDLVFPFFLFAMGAVVPFGVPSRLDTKGVKATMQHTFLRTLKLLVFAIVIWQFHPWRCESLGFYAPIIGILTYIGFFLAFAKLPKLTASNSIKINILGWALVVVAGIFITLSGKKINPSENDAIIRVLANINFVGIGVWILTRHNPTLRLGIALIFLAQYVGGSTEGTWMRTIWLMNTPWNLSALMLLKYMLIFIPGTLVGDILANNTKTEITKSDTNTTSALLSFSMALGLTLTTLIGLLSRQVEVSFVVILVTLTAIGNWIFLQKRPATERALWTIGAVLLVAGYCAEPFQGGIKKDHATLSYFFITSGLATFWIWAFEILTAQTRSFLVEKIVDPIRLLGQNALMAYAMAGFLIVPLMGLTHLSDVFISKEQVALFGTLKAVFITVSMVILTAFFSKKKIFWKI